MFLQFLLPIAHVSIVSSLPEQTTTTTSSNKYYDRLVESLPNQWGKCVAITGTTSGLGYWTAVATAKRGPSCLLMLNRASNRSEHAENEVKKYAKPGTVVVTITCDLQSLASVREAAAKVNQIVAPYGGLDVLALNAGVMNQPDRRTPDGFDATMQTNHLSHFLLVKLLMPSLELAAKMRNEVRIVSHSSMARGTSAWTAGGRPMETKYFLKSEAGSLGGDGEPARTERYHQSKLANVAFAMAMHFKFAANPTTFANFKALSAAPGWSDTNLHFPAALDHEWLKHLFALSAPDGSCSLLSSMFLPSAKSGDFYEPRGLVNGPPIKVISEGAPLYLGALRSVARWVSGIRDAQVCASETRELLWSATEEGLGEKFIIGDDLVLV